MKIISLLILTYSLLFSKVYYSKVEPYELRSISSNVSGLVLFIDEDMIGKQLTSKAYIKIDADLDTRELHFIKDKLYFTRNTITSNEAILVNLKKSLLKKRENYKRVQKLKIKSTVEKDREFYDLVSSENSYLNTQKEINNLKVQVTDLKLREKQLQRSVKDKSLVAKDFVLYSILVKTGQVVGVATPLAQVADVSHAILTIFLDEEDVQDAQKKYVYIDGKKSKYKISRILNIADSKNISKYRAQIVIDSPKLFSKLVQIELKNE